MRYSHTFNIPYKTNLRKSERSSSFCEVIQSFIYFNFLYSRVDLYSTRVSVFAMLVSRSGSLHSIDSMKCLFLQGRCVVCSCGGWGVVLGSGE